MQSDEEMVLHSKRVDKLNFENRIAISLLLDQLYVIWW